MVKGAHLHIYITIVFTTIVYLPPVSCNNRNTKIFAINHNGHGTYSFQYETFEGMFRKEEGGIVSRHQGDSSWAVRGEYGYIDSNGKLYSVKYVADRNGYQPKLHDDTTRFNDRRII